MESINMKYDRRELFSVPDLKKRGWTNGLINRFLPEPDDERVNYYNRSGSTMELYLISRVETAERKTDFIATQKKAALRSKRMKEIAERKAEELIEQIEEMPITVRIIGEEQLSKDAYEHFILRKCSNIWSGNSDSSFLNRQAEKEFIERINFNYIRHKLTDYECALANQAKKVGAEAAREIIRARICQIIVDAYPQYTEACRRYLERKS